MQHSTNNAQGEQQDIIEGFIQSGEYATEEDVINAALKLLAGEKNQSAQLIRLRRLIDDGMNSGSPTSVDEEQLLKELKNS